MTTPSPSLARVARRNVIQPLANSPPVGGQAARNLSHDGVIGSGPAGFKAAASRSKMLPVA
jgi:hypothetical protein